MLKADMISVVVPVYNVENYLNDCIQSIVDQTYKNLEIILINDGSSDGSLAICDMWRNKDDRIKVISQCNCGVSTARNKGISCCSGNYIAFIDGDDTWKPDHLYRLYRRIKKFGVDLAISNYCDVYENGNKVIRMKRSSVNKMESFSYLQEILERFRGTSVCFKLFKMSIIKKEKMRFREDIYNFEDMLFLVKYLINSRLISYDGYVGYIRKVRTSGMTYGAMSSRKITAIKAFDAAQELIHENLGLKYQLKRNKANLLLSFMSDGGDVRYFLWNMLRRDIFLLSLKQWVKFILLCCAPKSYIFLKKIRSKLHELM